MLEKLKNGICPFTGKAYDCGRCEEYKNLEYPKGACTLHISLYFGCDRFCFRRGCMGHPKEGEAK